MKFPIQFHRPAFLKSDDNPRLKALFKKDKDDQPPSGGGRSAQAELLKQEDRRNRYRLLGGLVTISRPAGQKNSGKATAPIKIRLPMLTDQDGHTCKPTALANLDHYYAAMLNVPNIPLRKNHRGIYANQLNRHASGQDPEVSIRQIAKRHGSVQGEVLQSDDLVGIAADMGYATSVVSPSSMTEFRRHLIDELSVGHPLLACFPVSHGEPGRPRAGLPTFAYPERSGEREHARLVTGFDPQANTLTIAHWGKEYRNVPLSDFFLSMGILPDTREEEVYERTSQFPGRRKYELVPPDQVDTCDPDALRRSITPEENSGFRQRLFVITPDLRHERWQNAPAAGLTADSE